MRQSATFRIITASSGDVFKTYQIPFDDAKDLHALYHDARRTWDEYFVEAETSDYILSNSHTYKQQVELERDAITKAWYDGEVN